MISGSPIRALPPFLLGGAMAIMALVAAGLLLYGGPGFLPALVVVLASHLMTLGAGVAWGQGELGDDPVEVLRRRWFLLLLAVTLAAVFSGAWEWFRGFEARAVSQGLGLAFLSALPLFAGGTVLGSMASLPDRAEGLEAPASSALLGGGFGSLLFGLGLFPLFNSSTGVLLGCLVIVSGAALLHGQVLDRIVWASGVDRGASEGTEACLEEWFRAAPKMTRMALMEPERLRCVLNSDGGPALPLDQALNEGIHHWAPDGGRALLLGVGRLPLGLALTRAEPVLSSTGWEVVLAGEDLSTMEALRARLPQANGEGGLCFEEVSVRSAVEGRRALIRPSAFDLIALDTLCLEPEAMGLRLAPAVMDRLRDGLRPGGVLLIAPLQDGGRWGPLLGRARELSSVIPRVSLYVAGRTAPSAEEAVPSIRRTAWKRSQAEPGARSAFLLAGAGDRAPWPDRVGGYLRVMVEAGAPSTHGEGP